MVFQNSKVDDSPETTFVRHDLRDQESLNLRKFDCVIHLAALSNDPLGEINPDLTFSINRDSAIQLAKRAKSHGVRRFIFASTQSIYGFSGSESELSEDAPKNPITAYAKSKWQAEQEILGLASHDFATVAVRPSTIFGWGSRIRNDIIFNNMIASGIKKIELKFIQMALHTVLWYTFPMLWTFSFFYFTCLQISFKVRHITWVAREVILQFWKLLRQQVKALAVYQLC